MAKRQLHDKFLRREIGNRCICFNLRRAARLVTQQYDKTFQRSGLKVNQFSILIACYDPDGILLTGLAKRLGMDRTTLTRNLAHLENLGVVSIKSGDDRRERIVRVTDKGADLLEKAYPLWQQAQREIVSQIGRGGFKELLSSLHEVGKKL